MARMVVNKVHLYGGYQSERFGEMLHFLLPYGVGALGLSHIN